MTTAAPSLRAQPTRAAQAGYPADDLRFDWRFAFLSCLLSVGLIFGIGWSVHVWTGAVFLAGMVGLLLSLLTLAGKRAAAVGA